MSYAEKRGNLWRARWPGPGGKLESKSGFKTKKAAEDYAHDQEAAIRGGTYVDPRAGQISLTEWVNQWYPALDLEQSTLANYRYLIEVHILPTFGEWSLASITAQQVSTWERQIIAAGYAPRTARDARTALTTVLGDAIPRYIQVNPAQRRRGKGRKGLKRIARIEQAEKVWASPLQALLIAERCAALSGHDTDFVMTLTIAYTGMRWSEAVGLRPQFVNDDRIEVGWKLYELGGRFYLGRPKDGSIRTVDLPPFLAEMLAGLLGTDRGRSCTCRNTQPPWCSGGSYVFLGPGRGHFRRSSYGERTFRPAAEGWHPARGQQPRMPVLADVGGAFPGRPVPPWPAADTGQPFTPPLRRGVPRLSSDARTGRCPACGRAVPRRQDGCVAAHKDRNGRCPGSGHPPAEDIALASWLPILRGLTPHGLRHGHQTWMDEAGIPDALKAERMGHELPGMRGIYSHVSPAMRTDLKSVLQDLWLSALRERAAIAVHSPVPLLDDLIAAQTATR